MSGYIIYKFIKKYNCLNSEKILLRPNSENIVLSSEIFLFHKNYVTESELFKLKAPSEFFFQLVEIQIKSFEQFYNKNCYIKNLKKIFIYVCKENTNLISKFKEWFSSNHLCNEHRIFLLDFLILLLIRKNCTWTKEWMIKNEKNVQSIKRKNLTEISSKKLKIIKK